MDAPASTPETMVLATVAENSTFSVHTAAMTAATSSAHAPDLSSVLKNTPPEVMILRSMALSFVMLLRCIQVKKRTALGKRQTSRPGIEGNITWR